MSTCTNTIQAQYNLIVATYPNYGPQEVLNALVVASQGSCSCSNLIASIWTVANNNNLFPPTIYFSEQILMLARAIGAANVAGCDCNTVYSSFSAIVTPVYGTPSSDISTQQQLVIFWAKTLKFSQCGTISDVSTVLFNASFSVTNVVIALASALYNINDIAAILRDYLSTSFPSDCNFVASGTVAIPGDTLSESYLMIYSSATSDYMLFSFDHNGNPQYPCQIPPGTPPQYQPYTGTILIPSSLCQNNVTTICSYQSLITYSNSGEILIVSWPISVGSASTFFKNLSSGQRVSGFVQCGVSPYPIVQNTTTGLFNFLGNTSVLFGTPGDILISSICCGKSDILVLLKNSKGIFSLYEFDVTTDASLCIVDVTQKFSSYCYTELACQHYMFFNSTTNTGDKNRVTLFKDGLIFCPHTYENGFSIVQTLVEKDKVFMVAEKNSIFYLFAFNHEGTPIPFYGFSIGEQKHHLVEVQEMNGKVIIIFSDREPIILNQSREKCLQYECHNKNNLLQHTPHGYYLSGNQIGASTDTLLASDCCGQTTTFVLLSNNMLYQYNNATGLTSYAVNPQSANIYTYTVGTTQFIFSVHPEDKTFRFCPVSLGSAQPVSKVTLSRGCIFVLLTLLDNTKSIATLNEMGDIVSVIPVKNQKHVDQYWKRLNG